jgi:hypothetical protein
MQCRLRGGSAEDCAISERSGEGFEGIGDDGGAVEGAEFFGNGDGVEGIAEALGDGAEAEIECFEDGLAAGGEGAFLTAFFDSIPAAFHSAVLVKFLGEGHGCGAVGFGTDGFDFKEEGIVVNGVAAVHVADGEVKGVEKDHAEEFVVPDRGAEELA